MQNGLTTCIGNPIETEHIFTRTQTTSTMLFYASTGPQQMLLDFIAIYVSIGDSTSVQERICNVISKNDRCYHLSVPLTNANTCLLLGLALLQSKHYPCSCL